jgi:uncharacterized oxidoreductase
MKLSGNKILITGASQGIGKALVDAFLAQDNQIIAVGRNESTLRRMADIDPRITPFLCDLAIASQLNGLVEFIKREHTDLNILINNAGIQYNYQFSEEILISEKIEHEINVNLLVPLKLSSLLLPILQKNESAAIVNVSSALALTPKNDAVVYCSSKAGVHIFSRALRLQQQKVKVFELIPPLVDTAMTSGRGQNKMSPEDLAKAFLKAFSRNQNEIRVGKAKLLHLLYRLSPGLAEKILQGGQ